MTLLIANKNCIEQLPGLLWYKKMSVGVGGIADYKSTLS
jgi:hypothetical protein